MVWQIIGIAIAMWLVWKSMSLGLRLIGWGLIALGAFNAGSAPELAGTVITIVVGVAALAAGHAVFYLRRGYFKPRLIQTLTGRTRHDAELDANGGRGPLTAGHRHSQAPEATSPSLQSVEGV